MKRVVTLPSGRSVSLGTYVNAWRTIRDELQNGVDRSIPDWFERGSGPARASHVLHQMRRGMMDRINRHDHRSSLRWKNLADDGPIREVARMAEAANSPRRAFRPSQWRHVSARWRERIRPERWSDEL